MNKVVSEKDAIETILKYDAEALKEDLIVIDGWVCVSWIQYTRRGGAKLKYPADTNYVFHIHCGKHYGFSAHRAEAFYYRVRKIRCSTCKEKMPETMMGMVIIGALNL